MAKGFFNPCAVRNRVKSFANLPNFSCSRQLSGEEVGEGSVTLHNSSLLDG